MTSDKIWDGTGNHREREGQGTILGTIPQNLKLFCLMAYKTSAASVVQLLTYFYYYYYFNHLYYFGRRVAIPQGSGSMFHNGGRVFVPNLQLQIGEKWSSLLHIPTIIFSILLTMHFGSYGMGLSYFGKVFFFVTGNSLACTTWIS